MAENETTVTLAKVLLGDTTKEYVDKINKAIENVNSNSDDIDNLITAVENAGKVDDVKVNDISVVSNKIANLKVKGSATVTVTTSETGEINISAPTLAKSLTLSVDTSTYILTAKLKDANGNVLSITSVDLPLETMVVGASYDETNKKIVLTLQNGNTTSFSVADLVSGLVPDSRTINGKNLKSNVTLTQDDVGDGTSYVRFTPAEKEKLKNIATGANNYQPPTYTGLPTTKGLYKIRVNSNGDVVEATAVAKSDITALGIAGNENATPSKAGLMSATDKAKLNGIAELANKYVLPNAGATLGGVKSGGDVTIQDGVITVTSVGGKTADEIGKVKDVRVNGTTVLGSDGVANITIDDLKAGYVSVSSSSLVDFTVKGTTYKAIKVADTDTELEVYNSAGNKILTHTVRQEGYLYICVGTTAIDCTLRKINGNSVGTGGTSSVVKSVALTSGRVLITNNFLEVGKLYAVSIAGSSFRGFHGIYWHHLSLDDLYRFAYNNIVVSREYCLSINYESIGVIELDLRNMSNNEITEMDCTVYFREIGPSLLLPA